MRGTVAKRIRGFVKEDAPDLSKEVVYTTVTRGQEAKRVKGLPRNETTVLGECQRQYYKLLKKIWKR